jgi:hypothetical protein
MEKVTQADDFLLQWIVIYCLGNSTTIWVILGIAVCIREESSPLTKIIDMLAEAPTTMSKPSITLLAFLDQT